MGKAKKNRKRSTPKRARPAIAPMVDTSPEQHPHTAHLTATPERLAQGVHVVETRDVLDTGRPLSYGVRLLDQCPLDAYLRRSVIDWRQHDAGSWLARCFKRAIHTPSMTAAYGERLGGGNGGDPGVDARKQLWRVLMAAGLATKGPAHAPFTIKGKVYEIPDSARASVVLTPAGNVAMAVCGLEEWAGGTRNLDKLRAALDAIAEHLKIGSPVSMQMKASRATPRNAEPTDQEADDIRREAILSRAATQYQPVP